MTSRLGFTQLAVELIANSHIEEQNVFYGAVTMGDVWRFGKLERNPQQITQDINLFKVPDDLDTLVRIRLGILEGEWKRSHSVCNRDSQPIITIEFEILLPLVWWLENINFVAITIL